MKVFPALLSAVVVCLAPLMPACAQEAPAKWGPGCNKALLDGEFSLAKAPEIACDTEKKAFIEKVIGEIKGGDNNRIRMGAPPDANIDSPEFTAFYLRAFADPGQDLDRYDRRMYSLLRRLNDSTSAAMLQDARLDWDTWRAWLLFENTAHTLDYYIYAPERTTTRAPLQLYCARQLLWAYLAQHAAAILKDPRRLTWWLTRLTDDLEAPGGRPQRRWLLLKFLAHQDPKREALMKFAVKPAFTTREWGEKIDLQQPHPLDPFLIVTGENPRLPPFSNAVTQMALNNKLSLTVFGIDPAAQPPTKASIVSLENTWYPVDQTKVINQESWSAAPPDQKDIPSRDRKRWYWDYDWGGTVRPYLGTTCYKFPEKDRTDGVFFFVYNQRLYVWPKAKMDTGVIQMLRIANLIDADAAAAFEKRGFVLLKETLVKE